MTDTPNPAADPEWRVLGMSDLHLRIARAVFESPGSAQPWVCAIIRYAPSADSLRAVLSAGLGPEEYIAWREAGVDSWDIIPWSKTLAQAGLTHDHMKRWRLGGHKAPTLPPLVPYLSKGTTLDEILEAIQNWNAEGLIVVLEAGLAIGDVIEMRRSRVSGHTLENWGSSGVPAAAWREWIAHDISVEAAARFYPTGVGAATPSAWLGLGLSSAAAADLIGMEVPIHTVREWVEGGFSPSDTVALIGARVSSEGARQWIAMGIAAPDAVTFIDGGVAIETALEWLEKTELSATEIVHFIQKDVSLEQAMEFERRGIGSDQVHRTDSGLWLDLDPWQEDPAEKLPNVIESGDVHITLWTTALGGDPVAHDVDFAWDGAHTADWYEDISIVNGGLSPASSSPARGVLAWPDGEDVVLTYTWSEMGLEGHARLVGMAPTNGGSASDPTQWIRLAKAVVDFVLLDLGSVSGADPVEYLDTVSGCITDLHEILREYLATNANTPQVDFGYWLDAQLAAERYEIVDDGDWQPTES